MDVLCQAKSGMGKTAVFVITVLQQLEAVQNEVGAVVLCHTRELAYQISHEFERFSTFLGDVTTAVVFGGIPISQQKEQLKLQPPNIVVGTPGRLKTLALDGTLNLKKCAHFVLDECDKMLEEIDMRADVQEIFKCTPHDKQVMMFTATLSKELRALCKKFMNDPMEIFVDDDQAHPPRFGAALRQARRIGKEPQTQRLARLSHVQPSRYLRLQRLPMQGAG